MTTLSTVRAQRRQYTVIGLVMASMLLFSILLPNISALIARAVWPGYTQYPWAVLAVNYGLFYLLAYPMAILWLRMFTVGTPPREKLGAANFWACLPICLTMTFVGNLLGQLFNLLIGLLRGEAPDNALESMVNSTPAWLLILFVVILGPTLEELLFRRALIDALYPLGEKTCVLMGGLIFGLIHGNFYQFFYAALIGALFTLIYCRTGKIRYTLILHMLFNFQGSIIAPKLLELVNSQALQQQDILSMLINDPIGTVIYFGYSMAMMVLGLVGVVLLILYGRKLVLRKSAVPLERPVITALLNPGMVIFLATALAVFVLRL